MRLSVLSDLHIETGVRLEEILPDVIPDVYVLAGDIHNGIKAEPFINMLLDNAPVVYVAGNHEFYYNRYPSTYDNIRGMCQQLNGMNPKHQVHFLENERTIVNDILFIGSTLWTDFDKKNETTMRLAVWGMRDYDLIKFDGDNRHQLHSEDIYKDFETSFNYIRAELMDVTMARSNTVVVTHHSPSFLGLAPEFKYDDLNGAFHSDLEGFIHEMQPALWLHGHTHIGCDYTIDKTRVVCNPHGYPYEARLRKTKFDKNLIVEI